MKRLSIIASALLIGTCAFAGLKWDPILGQLRQDDSTSSSSVVTQASGTVVGSMSVGTNLTVSGVSTAQTSVVNGNSTVGTNQTVGGNLIVGGNATITGVTTVDTIRASGTIYGNATSASDAAKFNNYDPDDFAGGLSSPNGSVDCQSAVTPGIPTAYTLKVGTLTNDWECDATIVATNELRYSITRMHKISQDVQVTSVDGMSGVGTGNWMICQGLCSTNWTTNGTYTSSITGDVTAVDFTWTAGNNLFFVLLGGTCDGYPTNEFHMGVDGKRIKTY